nr:DUF1090 domain-containing protein [Halomonas huangheensis]
MKLNRHLLLVCFCAVYAPGVLADGADSLCGAREEEVLQQLQLARESDNTHREQELRHTLEHIREYCTDEGLIADAEAAVRESREEVRGEQRSLEETLEEGVPEDIAEQREELGEAEKELNAHIQQLRALRGPQ